VGRNIRETLKKEPNNEGSSKAEENILNHYICSLYFNDDILIVEII